MSADASNADRIWTPAGVGPRRMTALALAVTDLDRIHRSTVRALLPAGTTRKSNHPSTGRINRVRVKFGLALQQFDQAGWIVREDELMVRILDRDALMDYALHDLDEMPSELIDLGQAMLAAQRLPVPDVAALEQRERELAALRALMRAPVGGIHRGRGKVRRVGVEGGARA